MGDVPTYLTRVAEAVEATLERLLPSEDTYPSSIHAVMRYSTFAGGKRIRPAFMMAAFEACGGQFGHHDVTLAGAAFEMFHTFSLMHDDLPCMDDDDFRRGKPTAHRAFTEALAVLGGDALCIYAFECLSRLNNVAIVREIAEALGTQGMIGGQVVDIESEGKRVDKAAVEYIHRNKTAALIRASVRTGAIIGNAPSHVLEHLSNYGNCVGLAFQVVDDILDEEGTTEQLGKDAGSDRERGKATFPAVVGMAESKRYAQELIDKACAELTIMGAHGHMLETLARFVGTRLS